MPRRALPGVGLTPLNYAFLLAASIGLFLFWSGPLWLADRDASHLGRIAFSYLAVIPLAALLLARARQLTWTHFVTTCGSAWAIKMLITIALYEVLAPGRAPDFEPRKASESFATRLASRYEPAHPPFSGMPVFGLVRREQVAVRDAVVFLEAPPPGAPSRSSDRVQVEIESGRYGKAIYVVARPASLQVVNRDPVLHTVRFSVEGRAHSSLPVPGSPTPLPLTVPPPGLYRLSCANHASESAWLLVTDHPYVTRTDQVGRYVLRDVPIGQIQISAIADSPGGLLRGTLQISIDRGHSEANISVALQALAAKWGGEK